MVETVEGWRMTLLHLQPTSRRAAMTPWTGTAPVVVDPIHLMTTAEYFAAAESADACIVVHYLYRRAGYSPAVAAWRNGAWPKRLLFPDEAESLETALAQRMPFSRCWTMLQQ